MLAAFVDHAKKTPDKNFVLEGKKCYTYGEGLKIAYGYAQFLKEQGVKEGDCVVVKVTQSAATLLCDMALEILHALFVPIEKVVAAERVNYIIEKTGAQIFISDKEMEVNARFLPLKELVNYSAEVDPDSIVLPDGEASGQILFTTGTTGTSKGVEMSNAASVRVAENVANGIGITENDTEIIPVPINHAYGLRRCYANIICGGTIIIMDGVVFIDRIWKGFTEQGATGMALVPAMLQVIFKLSGDKLGEFADKIRYIQIGAAVLPQADKEKLCELLPNTALYDFYGCSEAGCVCTADYNRYKDKHKSLGKPTCNASFRLILEDGTIADYPAPGATGRLCYGGSMNMKGYYKEPELTDETLKDGYIVTNDLATFDEDGFVTLLGRMDDVINSGGAKIAPTEIEEAAIGVPGLAECAVIGAPDQMAGEVPKMFCVMEEGATFDPVAINDYLMDKLEAYKVPKIFVQIDKIPRTYNGKILRRELKNM